jgi:hypothetical protein
MSKAFVFLLPLAVSKHIVDQVSSSDMTNKLGCMFNLNGNIYDLSPLSKSE